MKNRNILFFVCILLLCTGFSAFAQEEISAGQTSNTEASLSASSVDASQNIMLARSSADYRVTPGDVYTLSYTAGSTSVTYVITVDTSYRIRVSNLGVVNGAGKTFIQLKNEIETIVSNNYPLSGVQLVLTQPAIFNVFVTGEVRRAGEVPAWALSRLSSLSVIDITVLTSITAFASIRDVSVRSTNGQTKVYDLFKAQRLGDFSQDPYLRPGDVVTFNKIKRTVTINGAVERPGIYQLLEGENISELIKFYGNGLTSFADKTRIEITRMTNSKDIAGDKIFLTENDLENNYALESYDVITVPNINQLRPVLFVEGAVITDSEAQDLAVSSRIVVRFNSGETYASLTRRNIRWFSEVSDPENAYILRKNERIPINLNNSLYDASYRGEILVQENDVLIIPFKQYFVSVAGAVANPGRYPYIPDRDWEYYIGLAGGFIPSRNAGEAIKIIDFNGKRLNKTDIITPETTITATTNHFLYNFNQWGPVVISFASIVSAFLSIYLTVTR